MTGRRRKVGGLGLDTARRIVIEGVGGWVDFGSQPGRTAFHICVLLEALSRMSGRQSQANMLAGMGVGECGSTGASSYATYTFLFTDVVGSTRRWEADPAAMEVGLAAHDDTLAATVQAHRGTVFKRTGDGVHAVFSSAADAVRAAVEAQRELVLPVRMGIHSGEALEREGDYFGTTLNRCARLMEAGHGGQVLLSASTVSLVPDSWGPGIAVRDLGEHRLRDLSEPEHVFQVVAHDLAEEFPGLRSLDAVRHNLPVVRSSFVGRQLELEEVCERVRGGQFVTLTGIGGCGKTRLALEAAARLVECFPQGVFLVSLAALSDAELVGQALANALGLHLLDTDMGGLAGYLEGRRLLIVLDNCEHLLDACAELVDGLLARCPELHMLATSREALGLDGEYIFPVPSLNLETDAVRLFMDRANAARPGLRLDASNGRTVAGICRRLDGIPLAIELAAARTTHLAPAQILERLSDRFGLLTGGRRRVQRQQTLSAVMDWSYDLLSESEQTLLQRLAVFRGSFSLHAVEEVCTPDALDLLGSLVAKSLVSLQEGDPVLRYRLLETVRLYAEERLVATGEAAELRSVHRDWALTWIESLPIGELVGFGAGALVVSEADNLTTALDWSLQQGREDLVARIASRMIGYWWSYVRVAEMGAWWRELQRNLARLGPDLRAAALLVGTEHAMATGDFQEMEKLSAEAIALAAPDSWVAAHAWSRQALYWTYADPRRGRRCIEEGRRSAVAAGVPQFDRNTALWATNLLTGDPERDAELGAQALIEDVLKVARGSSVNMYFFLGIVAVLGDTETAKRLSADLPTHSPLDHYFTALLAAVIAWCERRREDAAGQLRAATALAREYAIPLGETSCLVGFAALAADDGDYETASRHLATVRSSGAFPFRTPLDVLVYRRVRAAVAEALDRHTAQRCRAQGAASSVRAALDTELALLKPSSTAP